MMNPQSLRSASFVAYFSHLSPQEAIQRCASLQGATEICSDADNWKAYIAKRYGLKFSVQRPDLITAEEWQAQAVALEKYKPDNTNRYYAFVYRDLPPMLFSDRDYATSDFNRNYQLYRELVKILIDLPGIPIVVSDYSRRLTFHVCDFYVQNRNVELVEDLDTKHRSYANTIFESQSLCQEWLLELFIPYYSTYINKGYSPTKFNIEYETVDSLGVFRWGVVHKKNINKILTILNPLFVEGQSVKMRVSLKGPKDQKVLNLARKSKRQRITFNLAYVPAKLV
jgi:hypothetical protein